MAHLAWRRTIIKVNTSLVCSLHKRAGAQATSCTSRRYSPSSQEIQTTNSWPLLPALPTRFLERVRSVLATQTRQFVQPATRYLDPLGTWISRATLSRSSVLSATCCVLVILHPSRSLFFRNHSYRKEQKRWKPSQPNVSPFWEGAGLSAFRAGYTGTCGHRHRRVVLTLTNRSIFYDRWHADDAVGTNLHHLGCWAHPRGD